MGSCGGAVTVDELETDFCKFVQLEDSEEEVSASSGGDNSDAEVYDDLKDGLQPKECSGKLSPCGHVSPAKTPGKVEDVDEPEMLLQKHLNVDPQHSTSSLQLVSALKGGREKIGIAPKKLSVTWAPDVYDPIPNSLSHTVKGNGNKKKSRKDKDKDNKKNKKGQKSGKDKKKLGKHGGRSDKAHRTVDTVSRFVHVSDDLGDFDVGSPDCCGSSFLRESQTKFHFSVAEAL